MPQAKVHRAPVMVPGWWAGVDLPDARATRVEVGDDMALRVTTTDGTRVVCGPGEATRLVVLPESLMPRWAPQVYRGLIQRTEYLMVLAERRVCLVLRLRDFSASHNDSAPSWVADVRDSSGAVAVAAALGLPLESPNADVVALVRSPVARKAALLFPISGADRPKWAAAQVLVASVVAFFSWPRGYGWDAAALALLSAGIAAPVYVRVFRLRRRFLTMADTLPDVAGATVLAPADAPTHGLAETRLFLSPEWVVLHSGGGEKTAAGSALGGITRCLLGRSIWLLTDTNVAQFSLGRRLWCPTSEATAEFVAACNAVGIRCEVSDEPPDMPTTVDEVPSGRYDKVIGSTVRYGYQTGAIQLPVPWFLFLLTVMLTGIGLVNAVVAPLDNQPLSRTWWGIPFTLVVGAALVLTMVNSLAVARWDRRQRKRARHPRPEQVQSAGQPLHPGPEGIGVGADGD